MGRHPDRIALARAFGMTDVVSERGADAVEHVRQLTKGQGAHSVLGCVGTLGRCRAPSISRAPGARSAAWEDRTTTRSLAQT